jgi:hypothetical protein
VLARVNGSRCCSWGGAFQIRRRPRHLARWPHNHHRRPTLGLPATVRVTKRQQQQAGCGSPAGAKGTHVPCSHSLNVDPISATSVTNSERSCWAGSAAAATAALGPLHTWHLCLQRPRRFCSFLEGRQQQQGAGYPAEGAARALRVQRPSVIPSQSAASGLGAQQQGGGLHDTSLCRQSPCTMSACQHTTAV